MPTRPAIDSASSYPLSPTCGPGDATALRTGCTAFRSDTATRLCQGRPPPLTGGASQRDFNRRWRSEPSRRPAPGHRAAGTARASRRAHGLQRLEQFLDSGYPNTQPRSRNPTGRVLRRILKHLLLALVYGALFPPGRRRGGIQVSAGGQVGPADLAHGQSPAGVGSLPGIRDRRLPGLSRTEGAPFPGVR
jgi:hypothetical protein